ncbi:GntR family transcriptional regulator [Frondihabitans sucicola]|uniref:GntR family transcriptional regulator n=1 Tax=Frondihabitans sucicola TaxID=1268041 RepID=A0ABM8GS83_9MICO|nr:GntR family transcriptional regulator [Frondihabitans sucicola]BDZ51299.1 GntR family transcriptional regulator [Frondihabitans sucicola]
MRASERAYEVLRSEILDWSLEPGTPLAEVELSLRLGISRTPVREALARLITDGLAEPVGGRGLVVSPFSGSDVVDVFEVRSALERQAAQLAARRRDVAVFLEIREALRRAPQLLALGAPGMAEYDETVARFDAAIDLSVENAYLVAALESARTHAARIRRLSHDDPQRLLDAAHEHLLIVDAIIDGDAQLAADATSVHLTRSLHWVQASLRSDHPEAAAAGSASPPELARAAAGTRPTKNGAA